MRIIFTILIFIPVFAHATKYYVANSGSDANNGTSTGTPFQTLAKALSVVVKHDSILCNGGDTLNGKITIPCDSLYFGSYGSGKPIFSGWQTLTMTNIGGNKYTGTATNSVPNLHTVLLNGSLAHKGRTPNTGYSFFFAGTTATRIITSLTGTPNYAGAEAVVRTRNWVTDVSKIATQNGDTLFLQSALTYTPFYIYPGGGQGVYWIQNLASLVDTVGEYSYDSTSKLITVYSVTAPTVSYSNSDTLVYIQNKKSITFDGIKFTGSNNKAVRFDTCRSITFPNCVFDFNGGDAIYGRVSPQTVIDHDSITNTLNNGVFMARSSDTTTITNSYFNHSGDIDGMAANGEGAAISIYTDGLRNFDTSNTILNSGYDGLLWEGKNSYFEHNFIDSFCLVKDDGGGIYTVGNTPETGSFIQNNIILNGIGVYTTAAGIYLDYNTDSITITNNSTSNNKSQGILFTYPHAITMTGNTSVDSLGVPFYIAAGGAIYRLRIHNNIFYQRDTIKVAYYTGNGVDSSVMTADTDYVLRPRKDALKYGAVNTSTFYSQSGFTTAKGLERNAHGTPSGIGSLVGSFYYNNTLSDSTISLPGLFVDARGNYYNNSVTIQPFQSVILFKADHEIPAPTILKSYFINSIK